MTPREILHGFFNEEWRTTTILSIVGIVVIIGGTKIFDWPGTVGGTLGCILRRRGLDPFGQVDRDPRA